MRCCCCYCHRLPLPLHLLCPSCRSTYMSCRGVSCVSFFFTLTMDVVVQFHFEWKKANLWLCDVRGFLTPPQRWRKIDERKHITAIVSYELDWLTRAKWKKYKAAAAAAQKNVWNTFTILIHVELCVCINKLQYNSVKSFCAITYTYTYRERDWLRVALKRSEKL